MIKSALVDMYEAASGTADCCGRCGASVVLFGRRAKILYRCHNCNLEYRLPHRGNGKQPLPRPQKRQQSSSSQDTTGTDQTECKETSQAKSALTKRHAKKTQCQVVAAAAADSNKFRVHQWNKSASATRPSAEVTNMPKVDVTPKRQKMRSCTDEQHSEHAAM